MNDRRTYRGAEEAVRFRMISVDLALMEIDEIQAAGRRVPMRAFSEFQSRRHAFDYELLTHLQENKILSIIFVIIFVLIFYNQVTGKYEIITKNKDTAHLGWFSAYY